MKLTAWQLFNRNFKQGDEVIVINDFDRVSWGRLGAVDNNGLWLMGAFYMTSRSTERRQGNKWLAWDSVRFMSHDGFPCKELLGADAHASLEHEPSAKEAMRNGLAETFGLIVFGDPFLIDSVAGVLHNPGNDGPEWEMEDGEECLELVAGDGARGMLWHLPTVFYAELVA